MTNHKNMFMKTRIIFLCLLLNSFIVTNVTYAAFPIKHATTVEAEVPTLAKAPQADKTIVLEKNITVNKRFSLFHKFRAIIHPDVEVVGGGPAWPGIIALIFGILAFSAFLALPFLLFSIGAVIFGAIGVGHGYSCRLLALIGLILGILALLALVV